VSTYGIRRRTPIIKADAVFGRNPAPVEVPRPASVDAMIEMFEFRDAWWFRGPVRLVTMAVIVAALLSLHPALLDAEHPDHVRSLGGLVVLCVFVLASAFLLAGVNDSVVEVGPDHLEVRFESFFKLRLPLTSVQSARMVDLPRWRYRWGLATNFRDRISCSHGGPMIEIELRTPRPLRIWPRTVQLTRLWLAVRDPDRFLAVLHRDIAHHDETASGALMPAL
jgi:hypothetical protein